MTDRCAVTEDSYRHHASEEERERRAEAVEREADRLRLQYDLVVSPADGGWEWVIVDSLSRDDDKIHDWALCESETAARAEGHRAYDRLITTIAESLYA